MLFRRFGVWVSGIFNETWVDCGVGSTVVSFTQTRMGSSGNLCRSNRPCRKLKTLTNFGYLSSNSYAKMPFKGCDFDDPRNQPSRCDNCPSNTIQIKSRDKKQPTHPNCPILGLHVSDSGLRKLISEIIPVFFSTTRRNLPQGYTYSVNPQCQP